MIAQTEIPRVRHYRFRPFSVADVELFEAQTRQTNEVDWLKRNDWHSLEKQERSYTGLDGERILGFAGFIECWPSRWMGWAMLSNTVDRYDLLWIHRTVKKEIESLPPKVRRLEVTVHKDFDAGHRWAQALGLEPESMMKAYDQMGNDHIMFVRIHK